ncbi:MAG: hypothetical protein EOO22_09895 [Comamonadaceae bacterium]|nr:MAG: hypothetical protein EOO22_09895 [Comamonadaceae bacterium]
MATNTPRLPGENNKAERHSGAKDPRGVFTELAIRSGAMTDAGELSEEMFRFATLVAEHCAGIADSHGAAEGSGDAGERIRAEMID